MPTFFWNKLSQFGENTKLNLWFQNSQNLQLYICEVLLKRCYRNFQSDLSALKLVPPPPPVATFCWCVTFSFITETEIFLFGNYSSCEKQKTKRVLVWKPEEHHLSALIKWQCFRNVTGKLQAACLLIWFPSILNVNFHIFPVSNFRFFLKNTHVKLMTEKLDEVIM